MTLPRLEYAFPSQPGRAAVVAPPHPLYGGRMDNPVVTTLASALADCGYAPLRFNWRGVGSSSGRPSGNLEDAVEDYVTAFDEARRVALAKAWATSAARTLAGGYSFGAIAAAEVALRREGEVERLVLVAPPAAMLESLDLGSCELPIHTIVGSNDSFAPVDELADVLGRCREARLDVIPDADHFFGYPFWTERLADLVRDALR